MRHITEEQYRVVKLLIDHVNEKIYFTDETQYQQYYSVLDSIRHLPQIPDPITGDKVPGSIQQFPPVVSHVDHTLANTRV